MSAQTLEKINIIPPIEPQLPAVATPMAMLAQAVERGATIEVLTKLMDLSDRYEATQARKAFDEAIAAAKAEIPPIVKTAKGHTGNYADFAAIARVVDPIISKHGLSYRFRTTQNGTINVTCVLSHRAGHFEEHSLSGPADAGPGRNAIQAIGSTLTYLQRYSLVQALGIAATKDDDGKAAGNGEVIAQTQADVLVDLIESVGADRKKFLEYMKADSIASIPSKDFQRAVDALNAKRKQQ